MSVFKSLCHYSNSRLFGAYAKAHGQNPGQETSFENYFGWLIEMKARWKKFSGLSTEEEFYSHVEDFIVWLEQEGVPAEERELLPSNTLWIVQEAPLA